MPDVGLQPARQRLAHHRMDLAMAINEAAGMTGEGMRQDVAWPKDFEHVRQDRVGIVGVLVLRQWPELAEVDVKRQVERLADLRGAAHCFVAPTREAADLRVALHAAHQVGVLAPGAYRVVHRNAVRPIELGVVVPFQASHHVGGDEGEHAGDGGLHGIFAKARKGQYRRAALVDDRGHARVDADGIGIEPKPAADVAINVRVGVDQAGQHQLAPHIDRFLRRRRQVSAHRRNPAIAHGDIEDTVEALRRIDDAAASKQEVVWRGLHDIHGVSLG